MTGIHSSLRHAMVKGPKLLLAAVGLLAAGAMQSWAAPVTYDAVSEFSSAQGGTTGVWSYGRLDRVGAVFSAGAFNNVTNRYEGPGANILLVGKGFLHPGCVIAGWQGGNVCVLDKAFANVRFTAPTAGVYKATFDLRLADPTNNPFNCEYSGCDQPGRADWRRDGVRMWLGSDFKDLSTWQGAAAVADSFAGMTLVESFTLAAGGTIDFSVDHNGARMCLTCTPTTRFNLYDSTNYTASVTLQAIPVPGSALLMAAGLPLLAWRAARRQR